MFTSRPLTGNWGRAADVECRMKRHSKLGPVLLAAAVAAGACTSTAGRASLTRTSGRASLATPTKGSNKSTDSSGQAQTSGTAINLNIQATVTQRDKGRTVNLHVGDGVAVGFTSNLCGISIDGPDMLSFYPIPTPPNWLYLHAVKPGRGALVARGSCKAEYTVTIVVS
jgi:hypothetical protein